MILRLQSAMHTLLFIIFALPFSSPLFAQQIVLEEDFESYINDADFVANSPWSGDLENFTLVTENGNQVLRLNDEDAGSSQIRTISTTAYGTWEFFIDQDFPPSNTNRGYIFLISDREDLNGPVNGYAIRTGENSSPNYFRIFRFENGSTAEELITGQLDISGGGPYQIRITRDDDGTWELYESEGYESEPQITGNAVDNTFTTSTHFGFRLNYTVTRAEHFFFDDIIIENSEDFDAVSADVVSANELDVFFNYPIDGASLQPASFSVDQGVDSPQAVNVESDFVVRLSFPVPFDDGVYMLAINNVENIFGGTIAPNTQVPFSVTNPFDVESITARSSSQIEVEFTEPPDTATLQNGNFEIREAGETAFINPTGIDYNPAADEFTILLNLGSPLSLGEYKLTINGITDEFGWPLRDDNVFDFEVDNPFFVTGFESLSRTDFLITFSQDVAAFTESDFTISGFGSPTNASAETADVIRITYATPVGLGGQELLINNVQSSEGWVIPENTTLPFTLFDTYEAGDLALSEFYYRVPVSWRTPEFDRPRYVEIFNRSGKLLNLRNYTLTGSNISIDKDLPIAPGQYLVMTRGVPVFEARFGDRNFVEADEFPTLNLTTSSSIVFETDQGELIEQLTYVANTWGGNEVSLERYLFEAPAEFRDNWAASEDALTGSPGLANTVVAPTDPPQAVTAAFPEPRTVRITFSRTLTDNSALNLSNFSLDNGTVFTSVEFTSDERTLEFKTQETLEDGFEYTLSYQNLEDILGNEISGTQQFSFTFENSFRILAAGLETPTTLRVHFTLPTNTSAVSLSDFQLADGPDPVGFTFPNSETVELTFGSPFDVGGYEIVVNNIESFNPDIGEQWVLESNSTAGFFRFDVYQPGDIVLNEFMYRPPDGYPRYVELHNVSGRFLNLKNWELRRAEGAGNNGGIISEFDLPIEPGGFLVITTDESQLQGLFGNGPWQQMGSYPGFTQTVGDHIRLIDGDGGLVQSLEYEPSVWGGNGISLERRSVSAPVNDVNNWGQSQAELLGTPGAPNSIGPGDDLPNLLAADFEDEQTVLLTFAGSLDFDAISASNFSISGGLSVTGVEFTNTVNAGLTLNEPMTSGTSYTVTASNIPDIFGNELAQATVTFTYFFVQEARPGDVAINEFMYNEPDGYTRYIELYNKSDRVFDMAGWQQANNTGTRRTLTEERVFFTPGTFIVILPNEDLLTIFPDMPFIDAGSSFSALKNGGDEIVITNAENVTLDSLRYESSWGGNGVALERRSINVISSDQNNWGESLDALLGTPGRPNTVAPIDEGPELVDADFIDNENISVEFTGAIDTDAVSPGNFGISGGRAIADVIFLTGTDAVLQLDGPMSSGTTYTLSVTNIPDIFGNVLSSGQASFTYYDIDVAQPGEVVINEIMYNEPDDYTRYIELFNRTDKAFNLEDWQQANDTGTRRTLTDERAILAPGSYIVIIPNLNLLSVFPDIPHINAGSSLSALKNGGDNIVIANAEGTIIDSLRYSPNWGGNGVALERRRADMSPLFQENWAESPAEMLGTPGAPNEVDPDFNLTAEDVRALNRREVQVRFNNAIEEDGVVAGNFSINGTNPDDITIADDDELLLHFSTDLPTGEHLLTINNIVTPGGFRIADNSQFTFFVFEIFEEGDIVINEFMYRPPSGYARYVELFNHSNKLLNLRNWRLQRRQIASENPRIISSDDLLMQPGDYLVITNDEAVMIDTFGERNYFELSNFPSLTATVADQIRLFTDNDVLADSLEYTPATWGGNGVALERISPEVPAALRANWAESPNQLLGTPGLPNEAVADDSPPEIISSGQFRDQGFILRFNKQPDRDTAMDHSNYSVSPALPISMVGLDGNDILLFAGGELISDQVYDISVSGITDVFGNMMEPVTVSVRYLEFSDVQPQDVVINEILYRRLQAGSPEFVEVYNRTDQNFDLSGWTLSDATGSATIPNGTSIRENDYLVFTDTQTFAAESDKIIYLSGFQSLGNTADAVVLRNGHSAAIDSVFYQASWYDNPAGISLERRDPSALSIDRANWALSTDERGSTPAGENSRFEIDETPPEILFANMPQSGEIQVVFSEFIDLTNGTEEMQDQMIAGPSDQANTLLSETRFMINGNTAELLEYNPQQGNRAVLDASGVSAGEEITLDIENLGDFQGNVSSSVSQPVAQPLSPGDLVFNEIMYNPIADSHDGLPDQSDYIEIHNRQSYAISLEGIFLHDEPDENGQFTRIDPVTTSTRWIPAGGYALFYPEPQVAPFTQSRTAVFFDLTEEIERFAFQAVRTTLSLPNSGRQIYLADSTLTTIDRVDYSPDWHNPNLVDTRGIALERVNPDLDTNNPANWSSNATVSGGTPGAENSIFQASEITTSETGVFLAPNPFSPDGNGFEDNLLINYRLDEPDYLLKVRIYDRYGRLVRTLAEGKNAGFEGTLIWDGLTDGGQRNRIGIYIILVEAYNSTSGKNRAFKETAVIARQF